jgi:hypothetical protein
MGSALGFRNSVCSNAMVIGHCVYGVPGDGIKLLHQMIKPGGFRFPSLVLQTATSATILLWTFYHVFNNWTAFSGNVQMEYFHWCSLYLCSFRPVGRW